MPGADLRELSSYVVSCSLNSLGSFYLKRLDRASHLEHELRRVARELVESLALAEVAELFLNHGEEIIANSVARPQTSQSRLVEPEKKPERDAWPFTGSNLYGIQDASDRSNPRAFLDSYEKLACWAIARSARSNAHRSGKNGEPQPWPADQLGWADVTQELIGDRCSVTAGRAKNVLRRLVGRGIVEVGHIGIGNRVVSGRRKGVSNWYRICPTDKWCIPKKPSLKKGARPERTRDVVTIDVGEKSSRVWAPKTPEQTLSGQTRIRVDAGPGSTELTVYPDPGPSEVRYPSSSRVETRAAGAPSPRTGALSRPTLSLIKDSGQVLTRAADAPSSSTRSAGSPTDGAAGSRRVPIIDLFSKPVCDPERGALVVDVPNDKELYRSRREEKDVLIRTPQGVFAWFLGRKGFAPRWEPLPAQPKRAPEREPIPLTSGPTGIWERVIGQIERAPKSSNMHVDPHTFSTWFRPTREEGTETDGTLVIRVPSRPFRKRLGETFETQIKVALATVLEFDGVTGEKAPRVKYSVDGDDEIVPPNSQTVEQYAGKFARGGTHK